jgi:hypothetical protein
MERKGKVMSKTAEVDLEIIRITDLAILFTDGDVDSNIWVPKELIFNIDDDWTEGQTIEVSLPVWLAEKEGLV